MSEEGFTSYPNIAAAAHALAGDRHTSTPVEEKGHLVRAGCSCGWRGFKARRKSATAADDWDLHVLLSETVAPGGVNCSGRQHYQTLCRDCDGIGWTEGGEVLQTTCASCGGLGATCCDRLWSDPIHALEALDK